MKFVNLLYAVVPIRHHPCSVQRFYEFSDYCFLFYTTTKIPQICTQHVWFMHYLLSKKIEWIIHSIYGVTKFHSLRSEFHSILTPVEWKFTTQRVESSPVHSIFTPDQKKWSPTSLPREWRQWQIEWKFTLFFLNREYGLIIQIVRNSPLIIQKISWRPEPVILSL